MTVNGKSRLKNENSKFYQEVKHYSFKSAVIEENAKNPKKYDKLQFVCIYLSETAVKCVSYKPHKN